MEKHCESCGMPLNNKEDFAKCDETSNFCIYCVDENGNIKSCEEILKVE